MGDVKICLDIGIAAANRSHFMAGYATLNAAKKLMEASGHTAVINAIDDAASERILNFRRHQQNLS